MDGAYQINRPYPQLLGLAENRRVGKILLRCYCGACSELTSANQYIYHYIMSLGEYAPVSEALQAIAATEQHHVYLLGNCIKRLGIDPKFRIAGRRNGSVCWTARNINYGSNMKEMLLNDIVFEQETIRQYENVLSNISNTQVQALLQRIIEDEKLHARLLTNLYNRYF